MGFLFGLLNLQFDFIQRIRQTFLLEANDKWSAIVYPCYYAATRAQLRRLRLQFQSVLATLRVMMRKNTHLLHQHLFYPGITYSLTSEL